MLKLFSSVQVRKADAYTIQNEPVQSIDLMERAAGSCVEWMNKFPGLASKSIHIFCGPGNNGGDGLVIARLLNKHNIKTTAYIPEESVSKSVDFAVNLDRAIASGVDIRSNKSFSEEIVADNTLIIDALFGSGLSKPLEGTYKELVEKINRCKCVTIAIDIPSGLYADKPIDSIKDSVIKADYTLSFQFPKLSFLFPENEHFIGNWHILPIGLHPDFMNSEPCGNYYIEYSDIRSIFKPRARFSHKGTFGHALLIGGCKGMIGASVLILFKPQYQKYWLRWMKAKTNALSFQSWIHIQP